MPDRPATLRDVAAAAGVHPATASRALNPETRILVSEDTARRVTEAAAKLGYRPNPVARSLRTRRSHTVGVLIPDLNNPLFPPIVRGLEDKLSAAGYVALLGNTDADASRERTLFEQIEVRRIANTEGDARVHFRALLHRWTLLEVAHLDTEGMAAAAVHAAAGELEHAHLLAARFRILQVLSADAARIAHPGAAQHHGVVG